MTDQPGTKHAKKRRIHLNALCLEEYEKSEEGHAALTVPATLIKSSRDPNHRMYPSGFKSAKAVYDPGASSQEEKKAEQAKIEDFFKVATTKSQNCTVSKADWVVRHTTTASSSSTFTATPSTVAYPTQLPADLDCKPCSQTSASSQGSQDPVCKVIDLTDDFSDDEGLAEVDCDLHSNLRKLNQKLQEGQRKLAEAQKQNTGRRRTQSMPKGKTKRKATARFTRDNSFLYSQNSASSCGSTLLDLDRKLSPVNDPYGLLGTGQTPPTSEGQDYFAGLPLKVIENIFCRLPIMDLCANLKRVCRRWEQIISVDGVSTSICTGGHLFYNSEA